MTAPTEDLLRAKWNEFAPDFQRKAEPVTMVTAHALMVWIGVHSPEEQKILEVGCGAGGATALANFLRGPKTSLTALDLSPEMLKLARARFAESNKLLQKEDVPFIEGSAEALPFSDGSFDKLYSNYCVHLVCNPDKALREAHRVLKKGGIAAWSVWGRPENALRFSIVGSVREKLVQKWGLQTPPKERSPFHLHDMQHFRQMILDAGFSQCYAWYQAEVEPSKSGKEYAEYCFTEGSPELRRFYNSLTAEQQKEFFTAIEDEVDKLFKEGRTLQSEALIAVAIA